MSDIAADRVERVERGNCQAACPIPAIELGNGPGLRGVIVQSTRRRKRPVPHQPPAAVSGDRTVRTSTGPTKIKAVF